MPFVHRGLVVLFVVLGLALVGAGPAQACDCSGPPTPDELVARADLLYLADLRVASRDSDSRRDSVTYDVDVVEPFVGSTARRREITDSAERGSSCGELRILEPGRYLVEEYGDGRIGGACSRPQRVDVDSDAVIAVRAAVQDRGGSVALLPDPPAETSSGGPRVGPLLVAGVAVAGIVVLAVRRRGGSETQP